MEILVQRWFPTFDFVVRTPLSRAEAERVLDEAMTEPSTQSWPSPKPHLEGKVSGGTFRCQPRTSAFGGNAAPNVSGQLVPRTDGGTDVVVRVINWFVYLMTGFMVVMAGAVIVNGGSDRAGIVKGVLIGSWLLLCAAGIYATEATFVKKIFGRLFEDSQRDSQVARPEA
jgi:hypothetical protein